MSCLTKLLVFTPKYLHPTFRPLTVTEGNYGEKTSN
ncbi:hypothetical protein B6N60_01752 [Richelia sinica FACHB-800]|uniref:Uncharacterized protein n=1 Tax=Richelia sinica FACHB-800 TaxID=1357546 RepID=A0A975T7V9_9NOST|nr:hypothetical protein B6N60_01752 [Richelia sinica FACHB-800]